MSVLNCRKYNTIMKYANQTIKFEYIDDLGLRIFISTGNNHKFLQSLRQIVDIGKIVISVLIVSDTSIMIELLIVRSILS